MNLTGVEKKRNVDRSFVFGYPQFTAFPFTEARFKRNKYDKEKGKKTKINLKILKEKNYC